MNQLTYTLSNNWTRSKKILPSQVTGKLGLLILLLFIFLILRDFIFLAISVIVGSLSKIYINFINISIGIDLIYLLAVANGIKYGAAVGAITGLITYLLTFVWVPRFHLVEVFIALSVAASGFIAGSLGKDFTPVIAILLIFFIDLLLALISWFVFAFPPHMILIYYLSNFFFNIFLVNQFLTVIIG